MTTTKAAREASLGRRGRWGRRRPLSLPERASDRDEGVVLCLCGRRLPTKAKALLFLPFQLVFYVE
jgi:hypothetical protein